MTKVSELHDKWYREGPEYRAAYDASQPQYELISALLDARSHAGIDQEELARRMGIHVSAIARLEGWRSNPSVNTLRRVAEATGTKLKVSFVPDQKIPEPSSDVTEIEAKSQRKEFAT
ncbi:MAG: helix-turn-helix transcriptional regulator [Dehalococcoidia bacterium]|nr:helix-turn-helix transcriptional regulator [Dehalococcoidia bacterium]